MALVVGEVSEKIYHQLRPQALQYRQRFQKACRQLAWRSSWAILCKYPHTFWHHWKGKATKRHFILMWSCLARAGGVVGPLNCVWSAKGTCCFTGGHSRGESSVCWAREISFIKSQWMGTMITDGGRMGSGVCGFTVYCYFTVLGDGSVHYSKVEPGREQGPLPWIEMFGILDILQVKVVSDDLKQIIWTLKPVSQFF